MRPLLATALFAATPALAADSPNVVLVVVDTLRADRLGTYGSERAGVSPHIDAFASKSVVFERAISQAPWTLPSVASLFTGLYPTSHRIVLGLKAKVAPPGIDDLHAAQVLSPDVETLAERFQSKGYATAALLKSRVLQVDNGFDQGFDTNTFVEGEHFADGESAGELTDAAIRWLDQHPGEKPYFLYVHYMDPHMPYAAPGELETRWVPSDYTGGLTGTTADMGKLHKQDLPQEASHTAAMLGRYDAEVHYTDQQLGRLLKHLAARGDAGNTVIAMTADHGEQFFEHGSWLHRDLWVENIHVPLIVQAPGFAPRRVAHTVEMFDLNPTLTELAGVGTLPAIQAQSLVEEMRGAPPPDSQVFTEYSARVAFEEGGWKSIWKLNKPHATSVRDKPLLYDTGHDPREAVDVLAQHPTERQRLLDLHKKVAAAAKERAQGISEGAERDMSDAEVEALRALGYLDE